MKKIFEKIKVLMEENNEKNTINLSNISRNVDSQSSNTGSRPI